MKKKYIVPIVKNNSIATHYDVVCRLWQIQCKQR